MKTRTEVITGYVKISVVTFLDKTLNRYLCRWIKTINGKRHYSGSKRIIAPTMDIAIEKASAIKGYKPNLIQRI